ncbi:hypothetical protein M8J75_004870 [Diaphorina citri]|nr:hypothetical protein M8J75_004870 [Diaphorina citri]
MTELTSLADDKPDLESMMSNCSDVLRCSKIVVSDFIFTDHLIAVHNFNTAILGIVAVIEIAEEQTTDLVFYHEQKNAAQE